MHSRRRMMTMYHIDAASAIDSSAADIARAAGAYAGVGIEMLQHLRLRGIRATPVAGLTILFAACLAPASAGKPPAHWPVWRRRCVAFALGGDGRGCCDSRETARPLQM